MGVSLESILERTRAGLPGLRARRPALELAVGSAPPGVPFRSALQQARLGIIAEVKRRSPSAGAIAPDLDPVERARDYAAGGAAAVSVLTEGPHFGGSLDDLRRVAAALPLPVLRKDFILDEVQLLEARAAGASAALLIVRALGAGRLGELIAFARGIELAVLVEIHDRVELGMALDAGADTLGVNSRDLSSFRIDRAAAWRLLGDVPAGSVAVAESGMATRQDVEEAARSGADAVLIGSALSASSDPRGLLQEIVEVPRYGR
ncbi:MAG: indole-3-glycerol-phosphate synthase [Gemmatimonadales bacterium]